jgi:ATP-dependent Clp protease ATP-binding subunit ClpC
VFERFTESARHAVVLGQEEARTLRHNYIGTGHILLGLLREEGAAARVMESLEITFDRARGHVVRIVGSGEEVTTGQIPFTPRTKKVLELALREALSLGHNYIGTEHILLGLISDGEGVALRTRPDLDSGREEHEGVAVRVLHDLGADAEKIRNEVIRTLSSPEARARAARAEVTYASSEASIHVNPSAIVRRLLMSGAARALDDGRSQIEVADLLLALTRDEATSRLLASLGVDVTAVRNTLERESPPPD